MYLNVFPRTATAFLCKELRETVNEIANTPKKGDYMTERYLLSMFKDKPEVLTVKEAAKLLRTGQNKTYDVIKSGQLKTVKVGGKILVPKMRLIEFILKENKLDK